MFRQTDGPHTILEMLEVVSFHCLDCSQYCCLRFLALSLSFSLTLTPDFQLACSSSITPSPSLSLHSLLLSFSETPQGCCSLSVSVSCCHSFQLQGTLSLTAFTCPLLVPDLLITIPFFFLSISLHLPAEKNRTGTWDRFYRDQQWGTS